MINRKRKVNNLRSKIRAVPEYRYLGCPMTKNNSPWCFRMCEPEGNGKGQCGRPAPHAIRSRIQLSIDNYKGQKVTEIHIA